MDDMNISLKNEDIKKMVFQAQNGDENALEKLHNLFYPLRRSLVHKYTHGGDGHEDMDQQIAMIIVEGVLNYDEERHNNAITHIVSRTKWRALRYFQDEYRFRDRFINVAPDGVPEMFHNQPRPFFDEQDAVDYMDAKDKLKEIEEVISNLSDFEQDVFNMYFVDEMLQREIADYLDVTRTKVTRAVKSIRDALTEKNLNGNML